MHMSDLLAARSQMALSLGFHIVFSTIGIAMPFLMSTSHFLYLRTGDEIYLKLTKTWSKGVAILFAVGAVSGTVLSFELGLLWPKFMEYAGPIIGMPFSWEGTAFFLEAIALGLFLYGWNRMPRWAHWASGVAVGVSGVLSGMFVICANAWMNSPDGVRIVDGVVVEIDPVAAMFNRAAWHQGLHMTIAAFAATGMAVAGVHAYGLLKNPASVLHQKALRIALAIGAVASIVQPLHGDRMAKQVAQLQPTKLAAMEALFESEQRAPLLIGGIPDEETRSTRFGIRLPGMLSFLAHGDMSARVEGLDRVPQSEWPPIAITHYAFQIMVGIGSLLACVGCIALIALTRKKSWLTHRRFLRTLAWCTPLGFIAIEAGWVVTEVGRQPYIIYGIMRTADAVTPMPGLVVPMTLFASIYVLLSFVVGFLMVRQFRRVD